MILTDNETLVDLLNKRALGRTIVKSICENPDQPITVGVHGDWGAGKSSILKMVNEEFSNNPDTVCIEFNGWRFQGFGDAKISIIEGIVSRLVEERPLSSESGDFVKKAFKKIDWMKVARLGGNLAINFSAGIPTPEQLNKMFSKSDKESADSILTDYAGKFFKYFNVLRENSQTEETKNTPKEIGDFLKAFDKLIEEVEIKQLVVLIDDLDRCLPNVVVETLEAIRLFLFTRKTAFVIAADKELVELSVREHYPQRTDEPNLDDYASKYLEKLIQVPFHIPSLGETESRIYVTLLLIGGILGDNNHRYKKLIKRAENFLREPWKPNELNENLVRQTLQTDFDSIEEVFKISEAINSIVAGGINGNPRQIKRFLNDFFLRLKVADERKLKVDLNWQILAKLMLAEQYLTPLFSIIAESISRDERGYCQELSILMNAINSQNKSQEELLNLNEIKGHEGFKDAELNIWTSDETIDWLKLGPDLIEVNLSPYFYISQLETIGNRRIK